MELCFFYEHTSAQDSTCMHTFSLLQPHQNIKFVDKKSNKLYEIEVEREMVYLQLTALEMMNLFDHNEQLKIEGYFSSLQGKKTNNIVF